MNPKKVKKSSSDSISTKMSTLIESDLPTRYSLCVPSEEDQSPNFLKAEKIRL